MAIYVFGCEECGKGFELMRPISKIDATTECVHCGSQYTLRKPTVFSRPRHIGARAEAKGAERVIPGLYAAGPHAGLTVVDSAFENGERAVQIHDGRGTFLRSEFKGFREDIVLEGEAKGYTEDCEFR